MKDAPFKSNFAIVDITRGRKIVGDTIKRGGKIRVRIDMTIDTVQHHFDGISQEFSGEVHSVKVFKQPARAPKKRARR